MDDISPCEARPPSGSCTNRSRTGRSISKWKLIRRKKWINRTILDMKMQHLYPKFILFNFHKHKFITLKVERNNGKKYYLKVEDDFWKSWKFIWTIITLNNTKNMEEIPACLNHRWKPEIPVTRGRGGGNELINAFWWMNWNKKEEEERQCSSTAMQQSLWAQRDVRGRLWGCRRSSARATAAASTDSVGLCKRKRLRQKWKTSYHSALSTPG